MNPDLGPPLRQEKPFLVPPMLNLLPIDKVLKESQALYWANSSGSCTDFEMELPGEKRRLAVFSLCSEDEKIIFRAFQDWFAGAIRKFASAAKGYWTFHVLKFAMKDVPRSWDEFAMLLTNHALKMEVEERRLIQFGDLAGVLHKRAPAETGRAEARLHADFCRNDPAALVRYAVKQSACGADLILFRDLSRNPLCPDADAAAVVAAELKRKKTALPQVLYLHADSSQLHSLA